MKERKTNWTFSHLVYLTLRKVCKIYVVHEYIFREGFGPLRQTDTHFCSPEVISLRSKPWAWPMNSTAIRRSCAID